MSQNSTVRVNFALTRTLYKKSTHKKNMNIFYKLYFVQLRINRGEGGENSQLFSNKAIVLRMKKTQQKLNNVAKVELCSY